MAHLEAFGLELPLVETGGDIPKLILESLERGGRTLEDDDIIVVTEKIVSKSEGRVVDLSEVNPSGKAKELARRTEKDPRVVELILRESREILKIGGDFIITETNHGYICANAGIDSSNIEEGKVKLLPEDPDASAEKIRRAIKEKTSKDVGVVISDSFGRPFRYGSIGMAIGASGVNVLWDRRGEKDLYGKTLKTTRVAIGDCLASLANLITGDAHERIPVVIIKSCNFGGEGKALDLIRDREEDLFR
ncbi:MAG: coenzyme F420-0:L-glutamate ligase [Candidatus Hydrothermarchaeales archaeon]